VLRMIPVVVCLAAIACGLVQLRRSESIARCQIQRLELKEVSLRRQLWDQQVKLGEATSPERIRRRIEEVHPEWSQAGPSTKLTGRESPRP
jgi:hypothetical protein